MVAPRWTSLALAGILVVALAAPVAAQEVELKPARKVKVDKYLITAEEIADRPEMSTAYDVVKLLRPNFLKQTSLKGKIQSGYSIGPSSGPDLGVCRRDCPTTGTGTSTGSSGDPRSPSAAGAPARPSSGGGFGDEPPAGMVTAVLYIDEIRQPSLDALKTVRALEVHEIRYMNATEAMGRYGSGHEAGAVLLKTNRMRPK